MREDQDEVLLSVHDNYAYFKSPILGKHDAREETHIEEILVSLKHKHFQTP